MRDYLRESRSIRSPAVGCHWTLLGAYGCECAYGEKSSACVGCIKMLLQFRDISLREIRFFLALIISEYFPEFNSLSRPILNYWNRVLRYGISG